MAVALYKINADGLEKMEYIRRNWRGAGIGDPHAVKPQPLFQLSENDKMGNLIKGLQVELNRQKAHFEGGPFLARFEGQTKDKFF